MSSLSDSANGTLTTDVDDGVAAEKASGDAMMASATPGSVEQVDRVVNNPQLSEFILRVVDRIGVVRNKIRDCKTDIETQKALGKLTTSNGAVAADAGAELNLSDFSSARAEIKLAEAGAEFMQTMLQFDGLVEVMRASQISEVIENALQGKPDSPYSLDEEEVAYVKGLLLEQAEVSKQIVVLEEDRLQKSLEHMEAMVELERQMSFLGELYPSVTAITEDEGVGGPDGKAKKIIGSNGGGSALLEEKKATLADEEKKLSQMKYMVGQLIMAMDKEKVEPEMMNKCLDMMNRCGQTVQQIQDNTGN